MELKEKKKKKKKRRSSTGLLILCGLMLLVIVVLVMLLVAQNRKMRTPPPAVVPTAEPSATPEPTVDRNYDAGTPITFTPDLAALGIPDALTEDNAEVFSAAYFVDVTPPDIAAANALLIRHTGYDFVFLCYDGAYYYLGESWDGHGLIDAALCDLNFDDTYEVLYTYATGTGSDYTAKVGWFDLGTKQCVVAPVSGAERNFAIVAEDIHTMHIYNAKRTDGQTEGGYVLTLGAPVGELVEQDGALLLLLN